MSRWSIKRRVVNIGSGKFNKDINKRLFEDSKNAMKYMKTLTKIKPYSIRGSMLIIQILAYFNTKEMLEYLECSIAGAIELQEKMRTGFISLVIGLILVMFPIISKLDGTAVLEIALWIACYSLLMTFFIMIQFKLDKYYSYKFYINQAIKQIEKNECRL